MRGARAAQVVQVEERVGTDRAGLTGQEEVRCSAYKRGPQKTESP